MTSAEKFEEPLACPRCRAGFSDGANENPFHCKHCGCAYPAIGGVAWLFRYPDVMRSQWLSRWQQFKTQLTDRIAKIDQNLKSSQLLAPTKSRLTQLRSALEYNLKSLEKTLKPILEPTLEPAQLPGSPDPLLDKIPWTQHFDSYFNNIFRDWGNTQENEFSANFVSPESENTKGTVLVLGSGAGRLAYDLYFKWRPEKMYSLDINPLFVLLQKQMFDGETIELFELPRPPRDANHVAVKRTLKAPRIFSDKNDAAATHKTVRHLLADARNAPFRDHSIDMLVTPWLIDILPDNFGDLARRWNRLLKIGGEWRIFGPLSYNTSSFHNDLTSLTETEIAATLETCGFQLAEVKSERLPYLGSDAHAQKREETVWLFRAIKQRHEKEPPAQHMLPDWILHPDRPIPVDPFLLEHLGSVRLQTEAISLINGQSSLQMIAAQLAARYGAPENIALNTLRNLFSSLIETRLGSFR